MPRDCQPGTEGPPAPGGGRRPAGPGRAYGRCCRRAFRQTGRAPSGSPRSRCWSGPRPSARARRVPRGKGSERVVAATGAQELRYFLWIEFGAPGATRLSASTSSSTSPTRFLNRYPIPAAPAPGAAEQIGRITGLKVMREHQHPGLGMVAADGDRRAQSLVGVAGRHPHVYHRGVRTVLGHGSQQVVGVADGADHLMVTSARISARPARTMAESSATTIRIAAPVRSGVGRELNGDHGGASGRAADLQAAVHRTDPLGPPGQGLVVLASRGPQRMTPGPRTRANS